MLEPTKIPSRSQLHLRITPKEYPVKATGMALLHRCIKMDPTQFGCFLTVKSIINLELGQTKLGERQLEVSTSILQPRILEEKNIVQLPHLTLGEMKF